MDWQSILFTVIKIVLTVVLSWASERLIVYINEKLKDTKYAKYLTDAVDIVTRAVKTTYQTYVEALKDKNAFTKEAQKEALSQAVAIVKTQLNDEAKAYIEGNFGDLEAWIVNCIESVLYDLKN